MASVRPKIAVVDDEDSVRKSLERLLRSAGMEVEMFASGADFLDVILTRHPDCIILDLHMPNVSGFEVQARMLRAGVTWPVVVITGHDTPESRARALAGGAVAYLLKPIDDSALLDAISTAISNHAG